MSSALLNIDALAQHFEDKLRAQVASLPRCPADARKILRLHAGVLARREAEILSTVAVELRLLPTHETDDDAADGAGSRIHDSQIPSIVTGWPWTIGGKECAEHMGLPRLLADAFLASGLDGRRLPSDVDVDADELAGWLHARCPSRMLTYSTAMRDGSALGDFVSDCHRLPTPLLVSSGNVSTQQLRWLYVNVEPAQARASLRLFHQATQILRVLGSVSNGNAQRRLLDVIVPAALKSERAEDRLNDERVRDDLASAVRRHIARFMDHLKLHEETGCDTMIRAVEAAVTAVAKTHDEGFASYVEGIGKTGKMLARRLRETAGERSGRDVWRLWLYRPEGELYLVCLAQVLWREEVQPDTQHREAHRLPGIVRATMLDRILVPMTQHVSLPANDDDLRHGGDVRDERGRVIGTVALTTEATLAAVRSGCEAFGTVHGHLLIRALIHRAADWWTGKEDVQDARPRIRFRGGWNGLLDELGIARKFHQRMKDIAIAGQCIVWSTPTITDGGLWTWTEERGTRAGAGQVAFVLGDALAPGYANELRRSGSNSHAARLARRVVPELRFAPPMGGARSDEHGAIWTLHRLLVIELVDQAEALHVDGAVEITPARWSELADSARARRGLLPRTLDAWERGESESAPALLKRLGRDTWTLADPTRSSASTSPPAAPSA